MCAGSTDKGTGGPFLVTDQPLEKEGVKKSTECQSLSCFLLSFLLLFFFKT